MQFYKSGLFRDFCFGFALSVFIFIIVLGWGHAAISASERSTVAHALGQQQSDRQKSQSFTGTIVRDGELYLLKDASGQMYKLDNSQQAKSFEGKPVKVQGQLVADAKLIHVQSIVGTDA
jgi:hypothetical protein